MSNSFNFVLYVKEGNVETQLGKLDCFLQPNVLYVKNVILYSWQHGKATPGLFCRYNNINIIRRLLRYPQKMEYLAPNLDTQYCLIECIMLRLVTQTPKLDDTGLNPLYTMFVW
jgi:hypothetical protein